MAFSLCGFCSVFLSTQVNLPIFFTNSPYYSCLSLSWAGLDSLWKVAFTYLEVLLNKGIQHTPCHAVCCWVNFAPLEPLGAETVSCGVRLCHDTPRFLCVFVMSFLMESLPQVRSGMKCCHEALYMPRVLCSASEESCKDVNLAGVNCCF